MTMKIIIESMKELNDIIEMFSKGDMDGAVKNEESNDMERVMACICSEPGVSTGTICNDTKFGKQKVLRICRKLMDYGKIRSEGGLWFVFDDKDAEMNILEEE